MVQHDAHYQDMKTRNIKSVEDVRVLLPLQCSHPVLLYVAVMAFGLQEVTAQYVWLSVNFALLG